MKPCSLERTLQLDVSNSIDRIDAKRRCEPQSLKASKLNSTWPNHDLTKISIFSLEYLKSKINFSFRDFQKISETFKGFLRFSEISETSETLL